MSVPPVVTLEARLRRELSVPAGDRVTVAIPGATGEAWAATWGGQGRAWSARTIEDCNRAAKWLTADDGEGGLVIVLSSSGRVGARAAGAALGRTRRPLQVQVRAGQVWSDRTTLGRTIVITDPDDGGRVCYKTVTQSASRRTGKGQGRIARESLLSAYRLLPPDHPAYEAMRRDIAVRYPAQWKVMVSRGPEETEVITWFEGSQDSTDALARWLESESAWLAFREWAIASGEAQ
jgi:hypothetical protein